ncbi:hypothetical protein HPB52_015145 [Rhipicephalus sanguineus]|uniref:Uncharacterized protein n=1 Tax=Rhipicephalus sanguineus TaxID=34632 RepID=A0A9D4PQ07_RHISA|nr:hypothetical protein HPB52_015145 [Rhipicephalus sanguineus]
MSAKGADNGAGFCNEAALDADELCGYEWALDNVSTELYAGVTVGIVGEEAEEFQEGEEEVDGCQQVERDVAEVRGEADAMSEDDARRDGVVNWQGAANDTDGDIEGEQKKIVKKKKKNQDDELEKLLNGIVSEIEVIRVGQPKSAVEAVAHIHEKLPENHADSEMEDRTEQETKKAKAEPVRTRTQRKNKSEGEWCVSSLEVAHGAKKATASKCSKKDESIGLGAASAEEAS